MYIIPSASNISFSISPSDSSSSSLSSLSSSRGESCRSSVSSSSYNTKETFINHLENLAFHHNTLCLCVPQYFTYILIVLCQLFRFCRLPLWSHRMLDPFIHNVQINSQMYFDCSDLPWSENILTCQSTNKIWHRKETPWNVIYLHLSIR